MCKKLLCNLVGFVAVYLALACFAGCSGTSSDTENLPAKGGSAGSSGGTGGSAGSSGTGGSGGVAEAGLGGKAGSYGTGGSAGSSGTGGSGGTADAGLGGSAGSSGGTGGSAGTSTGGSAGQVVGDAGGDGPDDVAQGGSAGQAGSDAGDDVSSDAVSDASGDGGSVIVCPTCDELLTWDTTQSKHSTYGSKISTSSNWNDSYAWQMLKACPDWGIVGGHEGGTGDTLQIGACNDGVVLIWAYNLFSSIRLSQGWTGVTDTGLGIGASYQDFIQTYPDYTGSSMLIDASGYAMLVYANGIAVFKNSVLSELTVN